MNKGREDECLATLARLRNCSEDDILVRVEFLEIKALRLFDLETSARKYPQYQDGSTKSKFMMALNDYKSLITNKSLFKRLVVAVSLLYELLHKKLQIVDPFKCMIMTFQQWNGINAINYYA